LNPRYGFLPLGALKRKKEENWGFQFQSWRISVKNLSRDVDSLGAGGGEKESCIEDKVSRLHTYTVLPDFSWYNIPKWGKIYQMTSKYTKWP
jgi:hypothetical protein